MFPITVQCPHCAVSLMSTDTQIDGYEAIRVGLRVREQEVPLHLSAIYGSFRFVTNAAVETGDLTELFCPHCRRSLVTDSRCSVCGAPLAMLHLTVGGDVLFCSRRGCKNHRAETDNLERSLIALTSAHTQEA